MWLLVQVRGLAKEDNIADVDRVLWAAHFAGLVNPNLPPVYSSTSQFCSDAAGAANTVAIVTVEPATGGVGCAVG